MVIMMLNYVYYIYTMYMYKYLSIHKLYEVPRKIVFFQKDIGKISESPECGCMPGMVMFEQLLPTIEW